MHFPSLRGGASSILDIRNDSYEYPLRYCDVEVLQTDQYIVNVAAFLCSSCYRKYLITHVTWQLICHENNQNGYFVNTVADVITK